VRDEARRALQSIRFRCLATGVADDDHPLGVAVSFRVSPAEVPPVLVRRSRYVVGRFLGFAVFLAAGPWDTVKRPHKPLFEFRSPPEYYPAAPSRSAGADRLLSWASVPFSTLRVRRSTCHRLSRACYVPPSGFDYPLDGLLPPSPCRFCFTPAALMGFTLRSFPLSQGIRAFPHGRAHIPFNLPFNRHPKATGRPGRPRFLGFNPCESP
jgi:hypothetical protein